MWLIKLLLALGGAYVVVIAIMFAAQTYLIFPARMARAGGAMLPANAIPLQAETPDGDRLAGVHLPGKDPAGGERLLLLGFGGNAWNADVTALYLKELFPDLDVVTFHFRGYRPSTGRPSANALLSDGITIYDHIKAELGPMRVIAVGFSIGAGAAVHLAANRTVAGLILVSPFGSLKSLARAHYPWAPVGLLLRHQIETASQAAIVRAPTALIAAEFDRVVPPAHTEAVRKALSNLVLDRTISGADHNDLYNRIEFTAAMVQALELVRGDL